MIMISMQFTCMELMRKTYQKLNKYIFQRRSDQLLLGISKKLNNLDGFHNTLQYFLKLNNIIRISLN